MAEMSMVEKVAVALANHIHQGGDYGMTGEEAYEDRRDDYLAMARAAIEAMREPTPEMDDVGRDHNFSRYATPAWQAMIDAALSEEVAG